MPFDIPNYTLLRKLGEGAMAEVWLGEHKRNGRKAAIKILKPSATADSDFEKLFLREGQVLAAFDHPNIVKIYDNDRVGDIAYLVMEHLAGGTLFERMQRAPITIGEALGLIAQIAGALGAAHRQQVIHRDLKPANIMLRDETTPVLTDFGAVRLLDRSTIYGREGMIVGTPIYMSPEQVQGQTLTGGSDLYALGVIFFELLTGDRPFPGQSFPEIAAQHLYAPIPRLPPSIAMLQPILDRLLAKKPEGRYADAQEFVDDLRAVFIHDEALRQQVGYSGTSMAWSSQLRALGFVLDSEQKNEIRRAQGEYLRGQQDEYRRGQQGDPNALVTLAPPDSDQAAPRPPVPPSATLRTPLSTAPGAQGRYAIRLAGVALLLCVLAAAGWWWSQRPVSPEQPLAPVPSPTTPTAETPSPGQVSVAPASADGLSPPQPATGSADQPAAATGSDDAELAAAIAAISALELRNRYLVQLDDTVLDHRSRLVWTDHDNGADIDWTDAQNYCSARGAGWDVPTRQQLIDLIDTSGTLTQACGNGFCRVTPLIQLSAAGMWSREANVDHARLEAWMVDMGSAEQRAYAVVNPFGLRVLCVRAAAKD